MAFRFVISKGLKIRLVGAPVIGLLITFLFGGEQCFHYLDAFSLNWGFSSFVTFTVWSGNSEILKWLHARFPQPSQTFKRTLALFIGCSVYSFATFTVLEIGLAYLLQVPLKADNFILGLQVTFSITVPMTLLYETHYFYQNWEKASADAERLKKENVQAQLESLRAQVNPLFLFNSLNTLVSIIPDCPDTAMDFVHKLSYVYRYLLSVKERELVTLETELDFIESYLFLLKVRFGESLQVDVCIEEEDKDKKLPPISLQMLIENAIKHNIISNHKPLRLNIYSDKGHLVVQNNKQPKQSIEESTGIGLENIQKRYQILSDKTIGVLKDDSHFIVTLPLLST